MDTGHRNPETKMEGSPILKLTPSACLKEKAKAKAKAKAVLHCWQDTGVESWLTIVDCSLVEASVLMS